MRWSSVPHFKRPEEQLLAYAWVLEIANATHHLLFEFAERYGLGNLPAPAQP